MKLKRALLASALALPLVAPAFAADLPSRKGPPLLPLPVFSWTGFYIGVNGGFGGGLVDSRQILYSPPGSAFGEETRTLNASLPFGDFFGGAQAGFNYQFANRVVLGIETDFQFSALKLKARAAYDHIFAGAGGFFENNLAGAARFGQDWYGTTRLRLGYALSDRFLAYVTGGVAYSQFANSIQWVTGATGFGLTSATVGNGSDIKVGYAVGAGAEYALTQNLTFKTEYLYTRYPSLTVLAASYEGPTTGNSGVGPLRGDAPGIHVLRAGLNWKFDGVLGIAPVPFTDAPLFAAMPGFGWSGFYIGVNGGYGGGLIDTHLAQIQDTGGGVAEIQAIRARLGSGDFFGGGQIGYNLQLPSGVVLGIESDFQASAIRLRGRAVFNDTFVGFANGVYGRVDFGQDWFGTTRVRLGYAYDRFMPYITGGIAYASLSGALNYTTAATFAGLTSATGARASDTKIGYAAGLGLEYAIMPNVTLKTEYLYSHYSGLQFRGSGFLNTFGAGPETALVRAKDAGISVVRAGLNYKFGGDLPPVVARY